MKSIFAMFLLTLAFSQTAFAKIADCPTIKENSITYRSHGDYIEAFTDVTEADEDKIDINKVDVYIKEMQNRKILWHTQLFDSSNDVYDPNLEQDVQWNIACVLYANEKFIVARDKRGYRYTLDKTTGKLLKKDKFEFFMQGKIGKENFDSNAINAYYTHFLLARTAVDKDYLTITNLIDSKLNSALRIWVSKNQSALTYRLEYENNQHEKWAKTGINANELQSILIDYFDNKPLDFQHWQLVTDKTKGK